MDNPVGFLARVIGGAFAFVAAAGVIAAALDSSQPKTEGVTDEMEKKYKIHRKLGAGAFGTVYLVENSRGRLFALKTIGRTLGGVMSKEPAVMRKLDHANVVKLYEVGMDSNNINMVMNFMKGGSLQDLLTKVGKLSQSTVRLYFLQLCEAIDYLHGMDITHRDLKPDNILLASDDEKTLLKVSDFGLSKNHVEYYLTSGCGTKLFMAPEYWTTNRYSYKVDIWSLGIILYKCVSGDYPFYSPEAARKNECTFDQYVWNYVSREPIEIIEKLLTKNADLRPEISEILELQWLNDDKLLSTYAEIREKFDV